MNLITKVIILFSVLVSTCAYAGQPTVLMRVEGNTQGQIMGDSNQQACIGCIEIYGFSHEVTSPRDASTGLPTGARQHKPIVLTKETDSSTPLLANAFYNNESLFEVELIFIRHNESTPYYIIKLTNASIAEIRSTQDVGNAGPPKEQISFIYMEIIQTWVESDISADDDWVIPSA